MAEEIKVLTMEGFQRAMQTVDAELESKLEGVSVNGKPLIINADRTVNIDLSDYVTNDDVIVKDELEDYVTKEELKSYATKKDLRRVLEELLDSLR
jgi:uncharacterized protein YijF (DUF1287 family)